MILTAKPSVDGLQRAIELGAADYLTKPFDVRIVVERIDKRLGRPAHLSPR